MKRPSGYKVTNAEGLNTTYSDWGLNYDGQTRLIFTSDRLTGDGNTDDRTGNSWFNLYEADANGNDAKELTLSTAASNIFKDEYHIGPIALNKQPILLISP